jgi:hypothetical protein
MFGKLITIIFIGMIGILSNISIGFGDQDLYVNDGSTLYYVDSNTGQTIYITGLTTGSITDIEFYGWQLYGVKQTPLGTSNLLRINQDTGVVDIKSTIGISGINALAVSPDTTMYAANTSGQFIKMDPVTGGATIIGSFGSGISSSGDLAFSDDATLYASVKVSGHSNDYLSTVDLSSGNANIIGSIGFSNVFGLSFKNGMLYGATTSGHFIKIDTESGNGTLIGNNGISQMGMTKTLKQVPLNDALDNQLLSFTTGGDAPWIGQTSIYTYGNSSAQSGFLGYNKESWLETTVLGPGTLSFSWAVSSSIFPNTNYLSLYVDGSLSDHITNNSGWLNKTLDIGPGNHSLRWTYREDHDRATGRCGWVDHVKYTKKISTSVINSLLLSD